MQISCRAKFIKTGFISNSKFIKRRKCDIEFREIESFALQNKSCENFL